MRHIIPWILLWTLWASGIAHIHYKHIIRHGCLLAPAASVAIVEDVVTTEITFEELATMAEITRNIANKLTNIGAGLENGNSPIEAHTNEVTQLEKLLKWKMEQAWLVTTSILQDIPEPWISRKTNNTVRRKRGWFDLGGAALGKVFGLATESEFREVNKNLQKLGMAMMYQSKVIRNQHTAMLAIMKNLNKVETTTDNIISKLNSLEGNTTLFQHLTIIMESVDITITQLDNIRAHYQAFMKGVSSAGNGIVTISLLPIHMLHQVISIGVTRHALKPLFTETDIMLYYPYLEATLTPISILVHVPFITNDFFTVYQIYPFPSKINNTLVTIDTDTEIIMVSKTQDTVAFASESAIQDKCRSSLESLHLCPAYVFTFQPAETVPCELAIINDIDIDHHCTFTLAPDKLIHHQRIGHSQFFYFQNNVSVFITCPDVQTTHITASGLYTSPDYCSVLTPTLSTRSTRNHYAILNHTHRFF